MRSTMLLIILLLPLSYAQAKVIGQDIDYKVNGTVLKGYFAYDDSFSGKRPGIIVVHEWWGHNEYARQRARMLAELGYNAFALDMYGEGKQADHPKLAGEFAGAIKKDLPLAEKRFKAALEVLKKQQSTDPDKIAAIGYCFGGGIVLEMMRRGVKLAGVVSFHGSLTTDQSIVPNSIKTKVLICHGEEDPFTTTDQISAFKKEMQTAKIDYEFKTYTGAKHAFTNPDATALGQKFNIPLAYNAQADKASWQDMQVFLKGIFP